MDNRANYHKGNQGNPDKKGCKVDIEFDRITSTNSELAKLQEEFARKFKQLGDRYQEVKGKVGVQLAETLKGLETSLENVINF